MLLLITIEDDQGQELFSKPKNIVDEELVLLDEYENVWKNDKGEDLKWNLF
ncbi:hypothetical protein [Aquimarina sp. I32.4]|uniref:hypothetical protein n=1 Tax=Aquimarina sp. I32.4 TaxID=2053903 RepID=UPI001304BCA0|nr:hypothetical protein [Aquimarina sp. I32.4]